MSKAKGAQNARRVLERLRSNESASALAADLGTKDREITAAREVVRHIGEHQAAVAGLLPDVLAQAVVEAAVQIEHADFLKALAEGGAKGAASAAKRGLAILRSKGINVEVAQAGEAVFKQDASRPDDLACFISTSDGKGERAVWIPRAIRGGIQLVTVLLSDVGGISHVSSDEVSKKSFKRLREELLQHAQPHGISLLEVPPARARGYLAAARALSPGLTIDHEAQLTGLLGNPRDAVSPARSESALPPESEARRLAESGLLFDEPELRSWLPPAQTARAFAVKLDEIAKGDESQREETTRREAAAAATDYFDKAHRSRYAERLFECVEIWRQQGRADAADRAAATARALERDGEASGIPFCTRFFDRLRAKPRATFDG